MKKFLLLIFAIISIAIAFGIAENIKAQNNECAKPNELNEAAIEKCLSETKKALELLTKAIAPNEAQLNSIRNQINGIKNRVKDIENDIAIKKENINEGYKNLEKQQEILETTIRNFYIKSYYNSPILAFLSASSASEITQILAYQRAATDQDKVIIVNIAISIQDLETKKKNLENEQSRLAAIKANLDTESEKLDKIVSGAKAYQTVLSGQIAALSAKQQEIINARSGNFIASIGDGAFSSTGVSSKSNFLSSAPGGYYAVFSFGAYTHRNGMSQYGALGRFNRGQSAEEILKYYYQGVEISKVDTNQTIVVNGENTYGQTFNNESYQLEEYLKHIYEMPGSWPKDVLKAQAIAARSYAYGKSTICPGQGCQEFKREENTDNWKTAVKETEGMIMTGGSGNRQYSSTTGGWMNGTGWDTTDGQGGQYFLEKTYETIAGSPWVYSAWYVDIFGEYGPKGGTCGRSNPWLSPEEMADVINAYLVLTKGNSEEASRISPVTTSCWGGNPYSMEELRSTASKYGGISAATSTPVVTLGNGTTTQVVINGVPMDGANFKKAFALRAPGFVRIPQKGFAFYNIEKK
ncbi:MAG: SpoIID/LytB domain-containing protein [Candidatus Levybacteria bacterium]|nr:SpoIID/LytB domain-containing protein [Candidatus Levybacteria bacterium]MDZ4228026.1 SpoIID/LytB domain-containing protein [Candidatus Levybacteria bacterium]